MFLCVILVVNSRKNGVIGLLLLSWEIFGAGFYVGAYTEGRGTCGSQICTSPRTEQRPVPSLGFIPVNTFSSSPSMKLPVLSYLSATRSLLFMGKYNFNLSKKIFAYDCLKKVTAWAPFQILFEYSSFCSVSRQ